MKKYILLIAFGFFTVIQAQSQCSKTYSSTGVYPANLPDAAELVPYTQEIDFTFPADTTIGGQGIHIDSIKITAVSGFPGTTFNYVCGVASCTYSTSGSKYQGCITINGTAPKGSSGSYKIFVDLAGYFTIPFVGAQVYNISDSSVRFKVIDCSGVKTGISITDSNFCNGEQAIINAIGTGKFQWWKDGNKLADSLSAITVKNSGAYRAILIDSATGCIDSSNIIPVVVFPTPAKPMVSTSGFNSASCSIAGTNYIWKKNGQVDTTLNNRKDINVMAEAYFQCSYQDANGCWSDYSDSMQVKTGIKDLVAAYHISLQPNPSNGLYQLHINNSITEKYTITINDMKGMVVQTIKSAGADLYVPIDLTAFSAGIYTITIHADSGNAILRAVLNH